MSSESSVHYDPDTESIKIRNLGITDPEIVEFFEDGVDEAGFLRAVRVGVIALKVAETSREMDFVEKAVTNLRHEFQRHIDEFVEHVDAQLEENSTLIEEELDPKTDGTPINRLKKDLEEEFDKVRSKISKEMGREVEFQRSTHKGDDFEDQLGHIIQEFTIGPLDEVEHTGNQIGFLEDNRKGDYVITTEEGYRIVIEAKDWSDNLSKTTIKSELDEAIRNRKADTGLLVSRNASAAPETHIGWFHEFDPKRLYVALGQNQEDDLNPNFFKFAYNWARIRARQAQVDLATDIDGAWVNEQLERLKDDVEDMQSMRDQARNIQDAAKDLESKLNEKETELLETISGIRNEIVVG